MLNNVNSTEANRNMVIQRLGITEENKALLRKFMNRDALSGVSTPVKFPVKIPTYIPSDNDTVSISPESLAMLNTHQTTENIQPGTANARRAAAGLPIREIPPEFQQYVFRHTDFRIFAKSVLAPHMNNADEHLANMERAIFHPSLSAGANLTLAERTMLRESILQEARRIAQTYLGGEDAQRFIDGFASLIRETEMREKGYVRVVDRSDLNNVSFRKPFDKAGNHARVDFLQANMTAEQKAHRDALIEERNRLSDKAMDLVRGENGNLRLDWREYLQKHHLEAWRVFGEPPLLFETL